MPKFKNNQFQYIYDLYTVEPPKRGGSGLSRHYYNGLEFPDRKNLAPVRDSLAYAAYVAGRDKARKLAKMKAENEA